MVLVSSAKEAVCACCFRQFRLDERGRLFPHVYKLGFKERCAGWKFPPAGESLEGTRWLIDSLVRELESLQHAQLHLQTKPLLGGIGPYDRLYEPLWHQKVNLTELQLKCKQVEIDQLAATLKEWQLGTPLPGPARAHRSSLWKLRAGTEVPLCCATAEHRPSGDPIMLLTPDLVDCPACLMEMKKSSMIDG